MKPITVTQADPTAHCHQQQQRVIGITLCVEEMITVYEPNKNKYFLILFFS
jgi:hypothetical protein